MVSTAAGAITVIEQQLSLTLAECPNFREFVGAGDAAEAFERIHPDGLPQPPGDEDTYTLDELRALRPFALVWTVEEAGFSRRAISTSGDGYDFAGSGQLVAQFVRDVPSDIAGDLAEVDRQFKNVMGLVLDDLCRLSGQAGYFDFERVDFTGPWRSEPDVEADEGDWQAAEMTFTWDRA